MNSDFNYIVFDIMTSYYIILITIKMLHKPNSPSFTCKSTTNHKKKEGKDIKLKTKRN